MTDITVHTVDLGMRRRITSLVIAVVLLIAATAALLVLLMQQGHDQDQRFALASQQRAQQSQAIAALSAQVADLQSDNDRLQAVIVRQAAALDQATQALLDAGIPLPPLVQAEPMSEQQDRVDSSEPSASPSPSASPVVVPTAVPTAVPSSSPLLCLPLVGCIG